MKIHTVNETFFENILLQSQFDLTDPELSSCEKTDIKLMRGAFKEYLGIKDDKQKPTKLISVREMLEQISAKFNWYLEVFPIEECMKVQSMCWSIRKYNCANYSAESKRINVQELANVSLKVYRGVSKEYYLAAKQFLTSPNTLVYLNDRTRNNYFECSALGCYFVTCQNQGLAAYSAFGHETQHGVDGMMFDDMYPIFAELGPIFFETLIDDYVENRFHAANLHLDRLKNHNFSMNTLLGYLNMLKKFDDNGRTIIPGNIGSTLGVNTADELAKVYTLIMKDHFLRSMTYVLSFMKAIELREIYCCDKNSAIQQLQACTGGYDIRIDYATIIKSYENFLAELDRKRIKAYMKKF